MYFPTTTKQKYTAVALKGITYALSKAETKIPSNLNFAIWIKKYIYFSVHRNKRHILIQINECETKRYHLASESLSIIIGTSGSEWVSRTSVRID